MGWCVGLRDLVGVSGNFEGWIVKGESFDLLFWIRRVVASLLNEKYRNKVILLNKVNKNKIYASSK